MDQFINPFNQLDIFLLIFIRMISFIMVVPLFGQKNIPTYAKIGMSFFLSLIIFSIQSPMIRINYNNTIIEYAFIVVQEIIVGILIGFGVYMTFSIITLAGQLIDHQIGFSIVNVFDPLSQIQLSITANFYYYLILLIMLATNIHFFMIQGLVESYQLIPLGKMKVNPLIYTVVIKFFTDYFVLAFKISSPIFAGILIVNVILGVLARTVPQLNMFVVGMPLKVYAGLVILLITVVLIPAIVDFFNDKMIDIMDQLIRGMSS